MSPREIGRVASLPDHRHPGRAISPPRPVRVGADGPLVTVSVGTETARLDAAGRDLFMRLWCEAERQAEADDPYPPRETGPIPSKGLMAEVPGPVVAVTEPPAGSGARPDPAGVSSDGDEVP